MKLKMIINNIIISIIIGVFLACSVQADTLRGERYAFGNDIRLIDSNLKNIEKNTFGSLETTTNDANSFIDQEQPECGSPEMYHEGKFSAYDYSIVIGMLVISLGIGIFYGFFQKSSNDENSSSNEFLLGSGMSLFPVTLSLTTSFITAIELLGNPAEMFYNGTQFSLIVIPMIFVVPMALKVFYPIYFKLELTSCYEYLGIRFGKEIRIMGAILYIIQMSFYTSVAVLAPAVALSAATGLNIKLAVVLIYGVCVFYSSQGGMKAVVIADTFQAAVLAFSLVLILILGTIYTDGFDGVVKTASEHDRLEFFNINPNPTTRHTVWSVTIGGFFYWTSLLCTNQASVQKCMSLKKLKKASIALGFSVIGLILVFIINFYTGLMVFRHYSDCDPLKSGQITASDQLLPFYVMHVLDDHMQTVTGIFVAGIFAASLGTVASALNSLSGVTCEDILVNGFNMKITPIQGAKYGKWMSLGYGLFSFALVFVVEKLGGVLQVTLTLNGLVGGVTLGLFLLGIFFKKANAKGAFYGGLISLVFVIVIGVMAQIYNTEETSLPVSLEQCNCYLNSTTTTTTENSELTSKILINSHETIDNIDSSFDITAIYKISYMWYSMIGTISTIIFGLLLSILYDFIQKQKILRITNNINLADSGSKAAEAVQVTKIERKISLHNYGSVVLQPNDLVNQKYGIDNYGLSMCDEK